MPGKALFNPASRRTVALAALLAVSIVAAAAPAIAAAAPAAARQEEAKAEFLEGERLFQLGKFEEAISAYERAFGLDAQPAFLFNIALAHRRLHEVDGKLEHLVSARELYRNYLRLDPRSPRRPGVEKLIVELSARIDAERSKAPPSALPGPTEPAVAAPEPVAVAVSAAPAADATRPSAPPGPVPSPASMIATGAPTPSGAEGSSRLGWYIGGGVVLIAVGVALVFLLTADRSSSFDGPGIDLTPR
jgi:tetratricopeptide (TPR) repeat protein